MDTFHYKAREANENKRGCCSPQADPVNVRAVSIPKEDTATQVEFLPKFHVNTPWKPERIDSDHRRSFTLIFYN